MDDGIGLPRYSLAEEIAHSVTHGLGVVLSVAGLVVLVVFASLRGDAWHIAGCSVFGVTLVLLYSASTLYHSIPSPKAKHVLRIVDHSSIYLLIAGTYTPFTLVNLRGAWGWSLLVLVWAFALLGIVYKITAIGRFKSASVPFYLAMGWLVLIALKPLIRAVEPAGLVLIFLGGVLYTLGVVFYAWSRLPYNHAVWHLFVLAGSGFHFFAVLFFVIP